MKKLFVRSAAAAAALTMLLTGCGGAASDSSTASAGTPASGAESTGKELTYWSMWNSTEGQAKVIQEAADAYEAATGVHINIEWKGRDIKTLIGPALDAGEKVDFFDTDYMINAQQNGKYLADLTDMAAAAGYEEHALPILVENVKSWADGKLTVIPYQPYTTGVWYDKAMFENAGITETPTTWEEFLNVCEQLKASGVNAITCNSDGVSLLYGYQLARYIGQDKVLETLDNATWSDGEPVTVEDIYYTFDIATDNALSNHAGALAWTSDLKHKSEKGVLKTQGMFTYDRNDYWNPYPITEEEKDTVIYLRVSKVLGAVATLFTSILILPEHIWQPLVSETEQLNNASPSGEILYQYEHPVGCGAWTLDVSHSGRQMIVLRNRGEEYHLKAEDGSNLYKVDTIKLVLYMDENTAIYALLKGYVDMLDSSMSSNYLRLFEEEENIQVLNVAGTSTQTLVMNVNPQEQYKTAAREILMNKDVRQAIALAINQEELVSKVLNGAGSTASAGLMLENQTELYNPEADILSGDYEQRVQQANDILDKIYPNKDSSGYRLANGKKISFEILANPGELELVSFLQVQLQKIGIDVQYKAEGSMAEDTYLFDGDFDMTFQATIFNVSNVDVMYRSHFVSTNRTSNYGRLADEALTAKIDEMRTTLNQTAKYDAVKEIEVMIANLYYKVPVYASNVISVARTDRYTGYVAGPGETCFNLDTLENLKKAV